MARYSLGKATGSSNKSSRKHAPTGDHLVASTIEPISEIKKPQLVPQAWQGNTFISNPSPTLVPQLKLPSVKGVIPEPNRDFAQLAKALSTFNQQLSTWAYANIEHEKALKDYYDGKAEQIIGGEDPEGKTALQKLTKLQADLVEESSQVPYTEKDKEAGDIPKGKKVGEYRDGTTIESIEEATNLANRIKSNSRLQEAIKSKYNERAVIDRASSLDSLQKTATIKETKEIIENGVKKTIQVDKPIHELSPNDPRYLKWLDNQIWGGIELNGFEYNNVKGKIIQYRTNAMTSQSSNYKNHLDAVQLQDTRDTTRDIGTKLGTGDIDIVTARDELQSLVEKIWLYGADKETKEKLNKMIIQGTLTAYMKAVEERGTQLDLDALEKLFRGISIGPKESRGTGYTTDGQVILNPKQLWVNQFDEGWYEDQVYAVQSRLGRHDKKDKQVNDSFYNTNGINHFNEKIRPTLYKNGEFQYQNIETALETIEAWRLQEIENNPNATLSINKAANSMRAEVAGIFSSDKEADKLNITRAISAAYDSNNFDLVEFLISEFEKDWDFDIKALDWVNKQKEDIADRKRGSAKKVKELIKPLLADIKEWYVGRYGGLQITQGESDIDEQTNYAELERILVNTIIDNLQEKGLPLTAKNVQDELEAITTEWGDDPSLSGANLKKRLGIINRLLGDESKIEINDEGEVKVSFAGNTEKGLSSWQASYDPTNTGTVKVLNRNQKFKLSQMVNSSTPIFEQSVYEEVADRIFTKTKEGVKPGTIVQNLDPRLKVLIENLPDEFNNKTGTFLIHEMKKYGVEFDKEDENQLKKLDGLVISQNNDLDNRWSFANLSGGKDVLVSSTNLQGLLSPATKIVKRESSAPLSLKEIIQELNGATDFKGTTNPNYDAAKGDLRSHPSENYFHNFKPELIPYALKRIETITEKDINAMVMGALLEAGPTDRGKYEVVSSLLMRSVEPVNFINGQYVRGKPWAIGRVLAQKGQYEAIFDPGARAVRNGYTTVAPYSQKELESSQVNFVKLGKVLNTSPKEAKRLYDLWKGRLSKQLDFKR